MQAKIDKFRGPYFFLSNMWSVNVLYEGDTYTSVEHAYQAAKANNLEVRKWIRAQPSPWAAKSAGRAIKLRVDWEQVKIQIMEQLVRTKFTDCALRVRLLNTGNSWLVHGNNHGDKFWGVDANTEEGENYLGLILMKVREELKCQKR